MLILYNKMLSHLKNGILKKKIEIQLSVYNKLCLEVLEFLKKNGYIIGYSVLKSKQLKIFLKYTRNKDIIHKIHQISTSKKKIYKTLFWIKNYCITGWDYVFLTKKGVLWNSECIFLKTSGLLLFRIH